MKDELSLVGELLIVMVAEWGWEGLNGLIAGLSFNALFTVGGASLGLVVERLASVIFCEQEKWMCSPLNLWN